MNKTNGQTSSLKVKNDTFNGTEGVGDMTVISEQFYKSAIKEKQQCPITRGIWLTPNMMGVPQITARIGFKWFKNY